MILTAATATALAFDLIGGPKGNATLEQYHVNYKDTYITATHNPSTFSANYINVVKSSPLEAELFSYLNLEENWDGYGAVSPEHDLVYSAQKVLALIDKSDAVFKEHLKLMLSGDNEISLYWDFPDLYIELSVDEVGFFSYLINDKLNKHTLGEDDCHIKDGIPSDVYLRLDNYLNASIAE
jgi:hypothetical protein